MKNILFTYITPFHPDRGSIGRVTHTLTLELQKRGYNVFYLIYDCSITIRHEYDYPAPLEYLPSKECLSPENISFYQQFLKEHSIDVVINQSGNFEDSFLYFETGNSDVKVISVLHANPLVAYSTLWNEIKSLRNNTKIEKLKRIARILLFPKIKYQFKRSRIEQFRNLLPRTDFVCLLSKKFYPELSSLCSGYEDKYMAIPNPNMNMEKTSPVFANRKKELLYVGMLNRQKRVERLCRIWKKIYKEYPDWKLTIIGDGEKNHVDYLKSLVRKAERVSFEGFQNPIPYYQGASIFCMTSDYEGWGMVLTEAMQCGCIPVAFNSFASITDIIENERNGILIKPFDEKLYESKLRELMDDENKRKILSVNAMEDVKRYSVENVVDKWEEIFEK